jgi:hypothetical protein
MAAGPRGRTKKSNPLVLYSANTWLAYAIAEQYYGGIHYVWCTPHFDSNAVAPQDYAVPPSSSPSEILLGLSEEVKRGDRHSAKIQANRSGILRGAHNHRNAGNITEAQAAEIASILDQAQVSDYRPLLYVIPYTSVKRLVRALDPAEKAHPLSQEYVIDRLPRAAFDVIDMKRS